MDNPDKILMDTTDKAFISGFLKAANNQYDYMEKRIPFECNRNTIIWVHAFDNELKRYGAFRYYPCTNKGNVYLAIIPWGNPAIVYSMELANFLKGTPAEIKSE